MEIDEAKCETLLAAWMDHERWVQAGYPDPPDHDTKALGFELIRRHGPEPHGYYRDWLASFVADARGKADVLWDLKRLIERNDRSHPQEMERLRQAYVDPDQYFVAQWDNVFAKRFWTGLDHDTAAIYLKKYEVDAPLQFLANLREIRSTGTFDLALNRFRDPSGKLKKGVVADYVQAGLSEYPTLRRSVAEGYLPRLRNAIAHNSYEITNDTIRALDGSVSLRSVEFREHLEELEVVQNAVLWTHKAVLQEHGDLGNAGVIASGWVAQPDQPDLILFQLHPFWALDEEGTWMTPIELRIKGGPPGSLETDYGGRERTIGPITPELRPILDAITTKGGVRCALQPIMPCIHAHDPYLASEHGSFCASAKAVMKEVPLSVKE